MKRVRERDEPRTALEAGAPPAMVVEGREGQVLEVCKWVQRRLEVAGQIKRQAWGPSQRYLCPRNARLSA